MHSSDNLGNTSLANDVAQAYQRGDKAEDVDSDLFRLSDVRMLLPQIRPLGLLFAVANIRLWNHTEHNDAWSRLSASRASAKSTTRSHSDPSKHCRS